MTQLKPYIDQMISDAEQLGMKPSQLFMSQGTRRAFRGELITLLRGIGDELGPDEAGRYVESYAGIPIVVSDAVESVYLVSFGEELG